MMIKIYNIEGGQKEVSLLEGTALKKLKKVVLILKLIEIIKFSPKQQVRAPCLLKSREPLIQTDKNGLS